MRVVFRAVLAYEDARAELEERVRDEDGVALSMPVGMRTVARRCDRILVLDDGEIAETDNGMG